MQGVERNAVFGAREDIQYFWGGGRGSERWRPKLRNIVFRVAGGTVPAKVNSRYTITVLEGVVGKQPESGRLLYAKL